MLRKRFSASLLATLAVGWAMQTAEAGNLPVHSSTRCERCPDGVYVQQDGAIRRGWRAFWSHYQYNKHWPEPWVMPDREAVRQPLEMMVARGWQTQNTLATYHFYPDSDELTEAGQLVVEWIATASPARYRTVFVQRTIDPEMTAARVARVEKEIARILPDGEFCGVEETGVPAPTWSADDIDVTRRKWRETAPEPRLPAKSGIDVGN